MYYNYQQILSDLSQIAFHHEQINSFGFGDIEQITNDLETKVEPRYKRMYVVPGESIFQKNQITYKFSIIIMDRVEPDQNNQKDVMSDTLDIAQDIWTILYQSYQAQYGNFSWYINPDQDPEIVPFLEKFETNVGGWTLNISIVMPFDWSHCGLPVVGDFEFPQDTRFKSWRVVVDTIGDFAAAHEQVQSFGFGDIQQITNDIVTKKEPKYTRLYLMADKADIHSGQILLNYKVIVCDKVESDLSNREDVLNDTMEVAKDLFAKLYLSDYQAMWDCSVEPFIARFETVLGGWTMSLTLRQRFDYDRCVLPVTSFVSGLSWKEMKQLWKNANIEWSQE